jgi:glutaredoxin-related protein
MSLFIIGGTFAQDYVFFYGNGCPHCAKVEKFFSDNVIEKKFDLVQKEVYFNRVNLKEFQNYADKLKISMDKLGVPFLIVNSGEACSYINGDQNIITFFQDKLDATGSGQNCDQATLLTGGDTAGAISNRL